MGGVSAYGSTLDGSSRRLSIHCCWRAGELRLQPASVGVVRRGPPISCGSGLRLTPLPSGFFHVLTPASARHRGLWLGRAGGLLRLLLHPEQPLESRRNFLPETAALVRGFFAAAYIPDHALTEPRHLPRDSATQTLYDCLLR